MAEFNKQISKRGSNYKQQTSNLKQKNALFPYVCKKIPKCKI
jgi:hypothetical protein